MSTKKTPNGGQISYNGEAIPQGLLKVEAGGVFIGEHLGSRKEKV